MKTPKREQYYRTQKAAVYEDSEGVCPNHTAYEHARWKRKNRIKQLKRSLERYKHGTNLPFYCHELHAYLLLQELKKPGNKATASDWHFYMQSLKSIQSLIIHAIGQASRDAGAFLEREKGKEHQ